MSVFVKAIFGNVSVHGKLIKENAILPISEVEYDESVKRLEDAKLIKVSRNRNELLLHNSKGMAKAAEESLPSLNPPLDKTGKELPTVKTIDFATATPIEPKSDDSSKPASGDVQKSADVDTNVSNQKESKIPQVTK